MYPAPLLVEEEGLGRLSAALCLRRGPLQSQVLGKKYRAKWKAFMINIETADVYPGNLI